HPVASSKQRLPDNAPGPFFVDATCIDCDTCRVLAGDVFGDGEGHARVVRQPVDEAARLRAGMALVSCPTSSIGCEPKPSLDAAIAAFPAWVAAEDMPLTAPGETHPVPGALAVGHAGFASADSYGATSWLLRRPGGNVLVDSP